ncbi:hypothetical protein mRhiFer1_008482 [Rhinolophus ferrumequinum]|uniref:Uncharacterized protein n=1 Tax=Rhinolophus ferrumequinum TaxID=59479 RepID=A0A7J7UWX1_RHIFE|nr:hypothetical protein mRhiFer1_008482 [Rhinolophus ferrumequinum]
MRPASEDDSAPQQRARAPVHPPAGPAVASPTPRVTRRTILKRRQAVTQQAAPPPPTLPRSTQRPRGAGVKGTVNLESLSSPRSSTSVPGHLNRAAPLPGQRNRRVTPRSYTHPLLSLRAVPPVHCVTSHPEKRQTL